MGISFLAAASAKNACLLFITAVVFVTIHSCISLYSQKYIYTQQKPASVCRHESQANDVRESPTPTPGLPRRNLVSAKNIDLWISSAILDERANQTRIHIFGAERRNAVKAEFSCRWRYSKDTNDGIYVEVKAEHSLVDAHWPHWGPIFACHFSCRLPRGVSPETVSLVSRDGNSRFEDIPVEMGHRLNPRKPLAVCVKPATSALSVQRLVEWFETLRASGVSNVIMYHTDVMGNGRYVLEYYQKLGLLMLVSYPFLFSVLERVDTKKAQLSGQDRYAVYQQIYLTALQECLHNFRYSYEHLLFIDLDEVLLPIKPESLQTLVTRISQQRKDVAGYLFLTSWHFEEFGAKKNDDAVQNMYIHKYVESTEPIDNQPKCVVNTDLAETVNFHGVVTTIGDKYNTNTLVPWRDYGYLHHFRGRCDKKFEKKRCDEELLPKHRIDTVLLRYHDEVIVGVNKVIETIQLH